VAAADSLACCDVLTTLLWQCRSITPNRIAVGPCICKGALGTEKSFVLTKKKIFNSKESFLHISFSSIFNHLQNMAELGCAEVYGVLFIKTGTGRMHCCH